MSGGTSPRAILRASADIGRRWHVRLRRRIVVERLDDASSQPPRNWFVNGGVAALTIDDVQQRADVGRSQMYHYFENRNDLIAAVVEQIVEVVLGKSAQHAGSLHTIEDFDRWFAAAERMCGSRAGVGGCPIGSLVGQMAEQDEYARIALAGAFDRWKAPVVSSLTRLVEGGELSADLDAETFGDQVMAALQRGLLLAQIHRDPTRLRHALDGIRAALDVARIPSA